MFTSKKMIGMLFAGSAIALPLTLTSTPAVAGNVCDLDGGTAYPDSASGNNALACGANAQANGDASVAVGANANSPGENSIAIGNVALANADHSLVINTSTALNDTFAAENAIAIG